MAITLVGLAGAVTLMWILVAFWRGRRRHPLDELGTLDAHRERWR
jgi:hypothetical protein